ncbi:hypothetical protein AVEN_170541-1 [Araneus ventricosus]|uniref:Uncharacterized protein n=1 Tax=Araneus ventricosus TaxID=182803 RepID=A0A4Y2BZ01_ARAVE|nr:hypothetical protein AVEN_170541-1 [Araneus ventricosus]
MCLFWAFARLMRMLAPHESFRTSSKLMGHLRASLAHQLLKSLGYTEMLNPTRCYPHALLVAHILLILLQSAEFTFVLLAFVYVSALCPDFKDDGFQSG